MEEKDWNSLPACANIIKCLFPEEGTLPGNGTEYEHFTEVHRFDLLDVDLDGDPAGDRRIPAHLQLGHLALFQHFFAMENVEESQMFFTVLLHFATLIAVCVYYWQDIIDMIREFFLGIRDLASRGRRGREKLPPARRLVLLIIVATLPLFVVLPIKDLVEGAMSNVTFVSLRPAGHRLHPVFLRPDGPGAENGADCHCAGRPSGGLRPGAGHLARHLPVRHHHLGGDAAGL